MAASIRLTQAAFALLSCAGLYFTWIMAGYNRTFGLMKTLHDHDPHHLPLTKVPMRNVYTGVEAIDHQFQILDVFFYSLVSGEHPAASMQILNFAGQFGAAYSLTMIEGMRPGNKARVISYVAVWGMLFQLAAFAVVMPVLLASNLGTSPTTWPSTAVVLPNAAEVASIPISLAFAYIAPAILMALPAPSVVSHDRKQIYIAIWQVFPIWAAISQQVVKRVLGVCFPSLWKPSRMTGIWTLRLVYAFTLGLAMLSHVSSVTLASSYNILPLLFDRGLGSYLGFYRTFVPSAVVPAQAMSSITEGAFLFLQWDEILGSAAMLLWTSVMFTRSWASGGSVLRYPALLLAIPALSAFVGPCGCAVMLIWARDEVVFSSAGVEDKKTV